MNLQLFGKNALIYVIGNVSLRAASFLLIPIYTHSLSTSDYGLLATLLITIQIMFSVMDLGTRTGLMRFAKEYENKGLSGHLLSSSMLINITAGLIVTGISVLFLSPLFRSVLHTNHVYGYLILTCCAAMGQCLCIHMMSYYRAENEGKEFMFASIFATVLLVLVNFLFLLILHQRIKGALLAQVIVYGGLWLLVSVNVFSKIGIAVSSPLIRHLLRFGFPLIFASLGGLVTQASAMYFLSYFGSLEQVATYSLGLKIALISEVALILPFQLAYEPFVYANIGMPGIRLTIAKLLTYLMLAFTFVAFGIVLISRDLLLVIAPPEYFSAAYQTIFLTLPGIAFKGVYYVGQSLLLIKNKTYVTGTIVTIFSVLGVMLNYLLIPSWGMYGAIFVFNVTSISVALLLMVLGTMTFPIPLELRRLGIIGGLLASVLLSVFLLREARIYIYYTIILTTVCANITLLYSGNFFDEQEKSVIRGILRGIQRTLPV